MGPSLARRRHPASPEELTGSGLVCAEAPPAPADASLAGVLALQRTAGNAAVAQMLARYSAPTSAYSFGAADANARTPFTLDEEHASVMPRTTPGAPGVGVGFAAHTPAKPPILVSDDGSMAINSQAGEPREFYAAQDVIDKSNREARRPARRSGSARAATGSRQPDRPRPWRWSPRTSRPGRRRRRTSSSP